MNLKDTLKCDLARRRTPTFLNFVREYFDVFGDRTYKFIVWLRLVEFCKSTKYLKYTVGIPAYIIFHSMERRMGIYVDTNIQIGKGLSIIHPGGVFINCSGIGDNFSIYQNVTVGSNAKKGIPTIGNNVKIYTGSIVCGDINVGNNVVIGANSYIDKDLPDNSITYGAKSVVRNRYE